MSVAQVTSISQKTSSTPGPVEHEQGEGGDARRRAKPQPRLTRRLASRPSRAPPRRRRRSRARRREARDDAALRSSSVSIWPTGIEIFARRRAGSATSKRERRHRPSAARARACRPIREHHRGRAGGDQQPERPAAEHRWRRSATAIITTPAAKRVGRSDWRPTGRLRRSLIGRRSAARARRNRPAPARSAVAVEIGPERVDEQQFGISRLPEQEVGQALLARGADQQVERRQIGGVERAPRSSPRRSSSGAQLARRGPAGQRCGRLRPARPRAP